jgi:hypothetical protein
LRKHTWLPHKTIRASYLGYKEPALIPAFSPRRRRIVARRLGMVDDTNDSGIQFAIVFREFQPYAKNSLVKIFNQTVVF